MKPDLIVYLVDGGEGTGFVGWARRDFGGAMGILAFMEKDHAVEIAATMENPTILIYKMAALLDTCNEIETALCIQDGLGERWLIQDSRKGETR